MGIKKVLDAAGVTPAEFGVLCGVSKNMVYKWLKGSRPHKLREDKVNKLLAALTRAVEDGELPLASIDDARAKNLRDVVITNVKKVV